MDHPMLAPVDGSTTTGRWTAASFIIGVEVAERFAYYGIAANLITYLTGPLGEATATAAVRLNTWSGVSAMLPLAGAFVADSYLGRYRTIVASSLLYVLGLGMLSLSAAVLSSHSSGRVAFFYAALYLVAFAQGGHKPCVQAFGADQFDEKDPEESISRTSFFNWWYFGICFGTVFALLLLPYVQDDVSWAVGFGIPCIVMISSLIVFLLGTTRYRYCNSAGFNSPLDQLKMLFNATRTWLQSRITRRREEEADQDHTSRGEENPVRRILRLVPIWVTCLLYGVVFAQASTFFTKQAATLDRRIGSHFKIPPAALLSFIAISTLLFIPVYDRLIVPAARKLSWISSGMTMLQRIGIGMIFSLVSMVVAALVETKRLKVAADSSLQDQPRVALPMSLWWLVPQYVLFGIADVFTIVGLQEFFYDQIPDTLRSIGLSFYLSIFGVGSFISSFLISVIDRETKRRSGRSWFSNNLNRAHLYYFYWLLAGLSGLEFLAFLCLSQAYVYKKKTSTTTTTSAANAAPA